MQFITLASVKLFTLLLGIFILMLSVYPCTDTQACSAHNNRHHTEQNETQNHEEHHDTCPPLCHCGCCSVGYYEVMLYQINFPEPALIPASKATSFTSVFTLDFQNTIWQPPRSLA